MQPSLHMTQSSELSILIGILKTLFLFKMVDFDSIGSNKGMNNKCHNVQQQKRG